MAARLEEPTAFAPAPVNLIGGNNDYFSLACRPMVGRLAAAGGYWERPGHIGLWDVLARRELRAIPEPAGIASVAFSPDGPAWPRSGTATRRIRDAATGPVQVTFRLDSAARLAFSPDGKTLATASEGQNWLRDAASGKEVANLEGDLLRFHCVAFSHDGKTLAAGGGNWDAGGIAQVTLWDVPTRKQIGKLQGHNRPILALAFSPDNRRIATGAIDGTIRLWDGTARSRWRCCPATRTGLRGWPSPPTAGCWPAAATTRPCGPCGTR